MSRRAARHSLNEFEKALSISLSFPAGLAREKNSISPVIEA